MLLVKARNAVELFWDSLDGNERRLLVVWACYLLGSVLFALSGKADDRRRQEIRAVLHEELTAPRG